jgi:hypothetical protein
MKKRKKKFKPIHLHLDSPEELFSTYKCEVARGIIKAMQFAYENNVEVIDFAEVVLNKFMKVYLAIDTREFSELIDKNIKILEENEEYELCAIGIKLKENLQKTAKNKDL